MSRCTNVDWEWRNSLESECQLVSYRDTAVVEVLVFSVYHKAFAVVLPLNKICVQLRYSMSI